MSLSQIIKIAADFNTPSFSYFNNFLPAYKAFHKRQNVRRTIFKVIPLATIIIVASFSFVFINISNELDTPSHTGVEMSNHHTQHGKVVVFEGTVLDVTNFIKEHVKEKTESINLIDYFNGDEVWGVYVPGDEKFRYYYQCLGKGRYIVFVVND